MEIESVNIPLRHKLLLRRIDKIKNKHFNNKKINLLDIGASNGAFVELAKKKMSNINEIAAVEIDDTYQKRISNFVKFYHQDFQKNIGNVPTGKYQLVTLWELIEHVEDSYSFFRNVNKLLPNKGLVALTTPNVASFSRILKGKTWIGIRDQSHRVLYNKIALKMILENCGFKLVLMRNYFFPNRLSKAFDWLNNLLSFLPGGGMIFMVAMKDKEVGGDHNFL